MAELTPYTPRSQMSMDLLKAISEPRMTAQDLAMQEDQARVEEFGGIRMPTQMENVWKGIEKTTGIQPYGDQPKLDRAMMAADILAPGIKGKAAMPAFKEAMLPAMPLITKFGKWFKGWRDRDKFNLDQHIPHEPRSVHSMGPHFAKESDVSGGFAVGRGEGTPVQMNNPMTDFALERHYPKGTGVMTQVEFKGKGRRIPQKVEGGDYVDDYEAVGRDMANIVFGDPRLGKGAFRDYMRDSGQGKLTPSEAGSVWERLHAYKGGFVRESGHLEGKNFLKDKLAKIDEEIAKIRNWPPDMKKQKWSFVQRKNVDLNPKEFKDYQRVLIQDLKRDRKKARDHWKGRYVRDFGEYLKKSRQADKHFDSMARRDFMDFYQKKLADDGNTYVIYKNTNPDEYIDWSTRGRLPSGRQRVMNRDTAMVFDPANVKASWGK